MTFQRDKIGHMKVGLAIAVTTYAVTLDLRWTWAALSV